MRLLAFSDLHRDQRAAERLVALSEQADLVVGAGDFATMRRGLDEIVATLAAIERPTVVVPGNAESDAELAAASRAWPAATALHGAAAQIAELTVFGLGAAVPVTPFGAWSFDLDEDAAAEMLRAMRGADVFITHSPPHGVADVSSAGAHIGSTAIRAAIAQDQPRLVVCGHVHQSWGVSGKIDESTVVNAGPDGVWAILGDDGVALQPT